jgi:hypothetical protein
MEELGATFEYWSVIRLWYIAPLAHSEDIKDHETCMKFTSEGRRETLEYTGILDPYEKDREQFLRDEFAYPRWLPDGPTHGPGTTLQDFAYWVFIMIDVHKVVIDKYDRYPERNAGTGRETRNTELEYLLKTKEIFGELDPSVARQLREDMIGGRWAPLEGSVAN